MEVYQTLARDLVSLATTMEHAYIVGMAMAGAYLGACVYGFARDVGVSRVRA